MVKYTFDDHVNVQNIKYLKTGVSRLDVKYANE
jgi:hypothetical protein